MWHFCKSSDKRKVKRIQERALRAIYKSHSDMNEELLERANLNTLYNRRLQDIVVLMYRVNYGLVLDNVSNLFVCTDSEHSFQNNDFVIPHFSIICCGKHSIRYIGPFLWSNGSKGGAVVRALASHQCGPGSNPGVDAICGLSLLLFLSFAPRGFSLGTPVFPSP